MKITRLRAASDALSALRAAPTRRTSLSRGQHIVQQPCSPAASSRRQSRRSALLRTEVYTENGSRSAIYLCKCGQSLVVMPAAGSSLLLAVTISSKISTANSFPVALAQVSNGPLRSTHANRESRRAMTQCALTAIVCRPAWRATVIRTQLCPPRLHIDSKTLTQREKTSSKAALIKPVPLQPFD